MWMNAQLDRQQLWPISSHYLDICILGLKKTTYLLNTSHRHFSLTHLAQVVSQMCSQYSILM
jgi:hypothetical protein